MDCVRSGRGLAEQMKDDADIRADIADSHGLAERDLERLASPWHTDADLGRPIEVVTDMPKSRRLGFTGHFATDNASFDLFKRLRADKLIPSPEIVMAGRGRVWPTPRITHRRAWFRNLAGGVLSQWCQKTPSAPNL